MSKQREISSQAKMSSRIRVDAVDEVTPLLPDNNPTQYETLPGTTTPDIERADSPATTATTEDTPKSKSLLATLSVLLIGVFISQADTSLVLATYGKISSEFHDLESGSWLLSSYMLAMCVSQPFFGKLSDIYGRKRCLQVSYILFAIGTAGSGLGATMSQVIVSRAVQGAGGAGMVCMVSILLTDLVPLHEVAQYRSYVNIVQTTGRSCGGVVGGLLASTISWRWAFLIQCPPIFLSILLVEWKLHVPQKSLVNSKEETHAQKLKRIDFLGGIFLSLTILAILLVLDTGGQKYPWTHPIIITCACLTLVCGVTFCLVERYWAKEPIFPLHLLTHYGVMTSYSMISLQNMTQTALMFVIPIYFQVTQNASPGAAGAHLVPAVIGNAIGGLATGLWIKRTGLYKLPTLASSLLSALGFTLLILLWHGTTSISQSLVIFPTGLGTGIAHSAIFIGLTSGVAENEVAIAGSGLYLSGNFGGVAGVSAASAVYQGALKRRLEKMLRGSGREDADEIIRKAISDLSYIQNAGEKLRELMLPAYISAIQQVFWLSLVAALVALGIGLISREKRLPH